MKKPSKVIAYILFTSAISACEQQQPQNLATTQVSFQQTTLNIPSKWILTALPKTVVNSDGLETQSNAISLKLPLSEIGITAPKKNHSLQSNVILLVSSKTPNQVSSDIQDAQRQQGLYKNRIIEKDNLTGLYRVYAKAGHPKLWHYFAADSQNITINSQWIASCMVGPLEDEQTDLSNVKCSGKSDYQDVAFKFTTNAKYFSTAQQLDSALQATFKRWHSI